VQLNKAATHRQHMTDNDKQRYQRTVQLNKAATHRQHMTDNDKQRHQRIVQLNKAATHRQHMHVTMTNSVIRELCN